MFPLRQLARMQIGPASVLSGVSLLLCFLALLQHGITAPWHNAKIFHLAAVAAPIQAPHKKMNISSLTPDFPKLPFGGTKLMPDHRFVSLYGIPNNPQLGALGDQPMQPTITRAQQLADSYQPYAAEPVVPALEIIATVSSSTPTANGDYSLETDPSALQPWIEAAKQAHEYVILDLQSGRSDFLSQAKEYAGLLKDPDVGLALDPEWRLQPNQVPIAQIGSVDASEINRTANWLAQLTAQHHLPQKLFIVHQFQLGMITNRQTLEVLHAELAYIIQMDGNGSQIQKQATWQSITANVPVGVRFGWKNFYQQDHPMLDPASTMAITPKPWYVSYQ